MKYLALLLLLLVGCAPTVVQEVEVAATFYPLYDLTRGIAGEEINVYSVVPPTTEPHSFRPTPRDIEKIQNAKAFVITGLGFEKFEDDLVESTSIPIINTGENIQILSGYSHDHGHEEEHEDEHDELHEMDEEHEHEEEHEDEHDELHEMGEEHDHEEEHEDEHEGIHEMHDEHGHEEGTDPHVWVSPKNAIIMSENIKNGLINIFPEHKEAFEENFNIQKKNLEELHKRYEEGLASCKKDTIVVTHNAYQYLGKEYNFDVVSIGELSPESEPTPQQMREIVEETREHNLSYIFSEELVDPSVSESLASEVNAEVLVINPVAGSKENKSYIEIMDDNLNKLRDGLECHD